MNPRAVRFAVALPLAVLILTFFAPRGATAPPGKPTTDHATSIARRLPPAGIALPPAQRQEIDAALEKFSQRLRQAPRGGDLEALLPDVEIYEKAVRFALLFDEFYKPQDVSVALDLLKTGNERLDALSRGEHPWTQQRGLVVRGYRSSIDGSAQPYGLEIPAELDLTKPVPIYVWLHGRGDQATDLHFIRERQAKKGQIQPKNGIVLHPFGRFCLGFKSAGEIDVLDSIASVQSRYKTDPDRVALMGFSMGGAGAWHIGAHYADHFAVVHPGAGFVDVARYQKLSPDKYPAWYEQKLWGVYDVPDYVRNLFNVPVVAYSGEIDKQREAAEIMAQAFKSEGHQLTHLIGPGMPHKYHPDTLAEVMRLVQADVAKGRDRFPKTITLQTRTLRYNHMFWASLQGLGEHWADARLDAEAPDDGHLVVKTKNITSFVLTSPWKSGGAADRAIEVRVDGDVMSLKASDLGETESPRGGFTRGPREWMRTIDAPPEPAGTLHKRHGLQGPIDDAFMGPFLVVIPSGRCASEAVQKWTDAELRHLQDRWRAAFRGDLPMKKDTDVTPADIARCNLVLWGDAKANALTAKVLPGLPVQWADGKLTVASKPFDAASHVPVMIYPNPLNRAKYVVLNSGPTFREDDDRTNSLQNPKLPDWAVIDITTPPDGHAPGKVAGAGFFDEQWRVKP